MNPRRKPFNGPLVATKKIENGFVNLVSIRRPDHHLKPYITPKFPWGVAVAANGKISFFRFEKIETAETFLGMFCGERKNIMAHI